MLILITDRTGYYYKYFIRMSTILYKTACGINFFRENNLIQAISI